MHQTGRDMRQTRMKLNERARFMVLGLLFGGLCLVSIAGTALMIWHLS